MNHQDQIYQENENTIKRRRALYPRSPHGSIIGIFKLKKRKPKYQGQIIKKQNENIPDMCI